MMRRWGAGSWLCCFQFFVAEQIARMGWGPQYSMARNYISDLGATQSPLHAVMNGSFVLQGVLIVAGALGVRGNFRRFARLLFVVAGLGVLLVGLFPEDTKAKLHVIGAATHLFAGNLAMLALGCVWVYESKTRRWNSWTTLIAGTVGLLALTALAFRQSPTWHWDAGIVERFAAYPLPLWLTLTGFSLMRTERRMNESLRT